MDNKQEASNDGLFGRRSREKSREFQLRLSHSILDEVCSPHTSRCQLSPECTAAPRSDRAQLPPISARQKEEQLQHKKAKRLRPRSRQWHVTSHSDWRQNTVDTRTIYSDSNSHLLNTIGGGGDTLLRPLDASPRMAEHVPDSQDLVEKVLVLAQHLTLGRKGRHRSDQAVLPTVYAGFFSCPDRKKRYIDSLWTEYFKHRGNKDLGGGCVQGQRLNQGCTFCDVMGSKYCGGCREARDRGFAEKYERGFLPAEVRKPGAGKTGQTIAGMLERDGRHEAAVGADDHLQQTRAQARTSRRTLHTPNRILLPITHIPTGRDQKL